MDPYRDIIEFTTNREPVDEDSEEYRRFIAEWAFKGISEPSLVVGSVDEWLDGLLEPDPPSTTPQKPA